MGGFNPGAATLDIRLPQTLFYKNSLLIPYTNFTSRVFIRHSFDDALG